MATPSPVATSGLVVSLYTRPSPPVASRTARPCTAVSYPPRRRTPARRGPRRPRPQIDRRAEAANVTPGSELALHTVCARSRGRSNRLLRGRMRLRLCAASRVNARRIPSRSNSAPHSMSCLDRRRPLLDQCMNSSRSAQPCAGRQRVLLMQPTSVVVAERDGRSALRVFGRGTRAGLSLATTRTVPACDNSIAGVTLPHRADTKNRAPTSDSNKWRLDCFLRCEGDSSV